MGKIFKRIVDPITFIFFKTVLHHKYNTIRISRSARPCSRIAVDAISCLRVTSKRMRNLYHYAEQSEVHFASDPDKTRQGMRSLHVAGASREVADRHQPDPCKPFARLPYCTRPRRRGWKHHRETVPHDAYHISGGVIWRGYDPG